MGNEQANDSQFNQYQGYDNKKQNSKSNHYSAHHMNNNYNNKAYSVDDDINAYSDEAEHPQMVQGNADAEKILFGSDRRHQVIPYHDSRSIIKCIGWIDCQNAGGGRGTGTVFKVDQQGYAYALTARHVVKKARYGIFRRDKRKGKEIYQAQIVQTHRTCDIAIIKFKDKDAFYANILNGGTIYLQDCDTIDYNKDPYVGIYGYPGPGAQARAKRGELWGMERPAQGGSIHHNGQDVNLYFRRSKDQFVYNKFDTEGGQSGSAIYVSLDDVTFGIVGVHVAGGSLTNENIGEALTVSRIRWINKWT